MSTNQARTRPRTQRGNEEKRAEFSYKLGEAARLWRGRLDRQLKPLGISFLQWSTLARLSRARTNVVQKDLAALVGIEGPAMVGILDRLMGAKLLERRVASHDRRANTVHLTQRGEQMLVDAERALGKVRQQLLQDLDDAELTLCISVFERIAARANGLVDGETS